MFIVYKLIDDIEIEYGRYESLSLANDIAESVTKENNCPTVAVEGD